MFQDVPLRYSAKIQKQWNTWKKEDDLCSSTTCCDFETVRGKLPRRHLDAWHLVAAASRFQLKWHHWHTFERSWKGSKIELMIWSFGSNGHLYLECVSESGSIEMLRSGRNREFHRDDWGSQVGGRTSYHIGNMARAGSSMVSSTSGVGDLEWR